MQNLKVSGNLTPNPMKTSISNISTSLTQDSSGIYSVQIHKDDYLLSQHWSKVDEMSAWCFIDRIRKDQVRPGTNIDQCLANLQQAVREI